MRKKLLLVAGIIGLLLPAQANALTGSTSINCSKTTITPNESTTCTITGTSSDDVSAISAQLTSNGVINISSISTSSIWQGNGDGGDIQLYTDSNKNGTFAIATFAITASSEGVGTINLNSINFADSSFNDNAVSAKSFIITVKNEEQPQNNPTNDTTNNNVVNNNPTNNTVNTNINNNNSSTVDTTPTLSSDTSLKSITLSEGNIEFSKDTKEYFIEVTYDIEELEISAEATDSKATVTLPDDLKLKIGDNSFEIIVIAEDGTRDIYTINVTRLERELSTNSKLKSIEIKGYKIDFYSEILSYNLGNIKENNLTITAKTEDDNADVKIYGNDSIGKNDAIVIEVTAEDGSVTNYILYVSNIKKNNNTAVCLTISVMLLIISLGLNVFLVIKKVKNKDNTSNVQ